MEAFLYRLTIHNSVLEWTHNMGQRIWEIYIPQISAVVNEEGGMFRHEGPRGLLGRIEVDVPFEAMHDSVQIPVDVPYEAVVAIDQYIKQQEEITKIRKQLFDEIKVKFKDKENT